MTLPTTQPINGTEDDSDMFGPPRSSPPIGYHHHRSKVPMISPKLRQREERKRILQLCAHKLERIKDSEANLRRSVCINNTYSRLTDELRREKQSRYLANLPKSEIKPEAAHNNTFSSYKCSGSSNTNNNDNGINLNSNHNNNNNNNCSNNNNNNNSNNNHNNNNNNNNNNNTNNNNNNCGNSNLQHKNDPMEMYPSSTIQSYHNLHYQQQQCHQSSISSPASTTCITTSVHSTAKPTIPYISNNNSNNNNINNSHNNNNNNNNNNSNNNSNNLNNGNNNNSILSTSSSCQFYSNNNSSSILTSSSSSSSSAAGATTTIVSATTTPKECALISSYSQTSTISTSTTTFTCHGNKSTTIITKDNNSTTATSLPSSSSMITPLSITTTTTTTNRNNNNNNLLCHDLEILDRELSAIDATMPLTDPEITQGAEHLEKAVSSRKRLRSEDDSDRFVRETLSHFYLPTTQSTAQKLISSVIDDCPLDLKRQKLSSICGSNNIIGGGGINGINGIHGIHGLHGLTNIGNNCFNYGIGIGLGFGIGNSLVSNSYTIGCCSQVVASSLMSAASVTSSGTSILTNNCSNNNNNTNTNTNNNNNNNNLITNDLDLELALDLNPPNQKEFEVIMDALRLGTPSPTPSCGSDSCGQAAMMSETGCNPGGIFNNLVVTSLET